MKLNRFVNQLLNVLIFLLLLEFTICQRKKNHRNEEPGSQPVVKQRSAGTQTDEVVVMIDSSRSGKPGHGPKGPHGKEGQGHPHGHAKKPKDRDRVGVDSMAEDGYNMGNHKPNADTYDDGYEPVRPTTHRPKKPTSKPKPVIKPPEDVVDLPQSEWRSLERLKHHWENTAHTKSALSKKFIFFLVRDADYQRHDACLTPENELGHCHYIQHCPIPDVIRSFDKFLSYACFIHNRYVGICCPEDYFDDTDFQPPKPVATTRRPAPHKAKKPQNTNDGSDYTNGICGESENTRIIGGALADPKEWLWMSAIILKSEKRPFCGGALITNQHILTAAHCLPDLTPDDVTVRLGAYDFSASADPEAQDFSIDYFKIHPNYNRFTNENDLAIIKLSAKTAFTDSIKPICLPQKNRDYAGQLAIVTGWGHTSFGGKGSPQLRQVSLPVWNNTSCDASYSIAITDYMLCAGNRNGGKDSCQGDSGGPLMLQGPNKRWMIIGVVSFGVKCGTPNYPGVYTRISKYIDWIKTHTKDI